MTFWILQAVSYFDSHFILDYRIYMLMLLLPLLAMVLLPSLKYFAPFSFVANVCEVTALGMLFYYIFQDLPPMDSRRQLPSFQALPLWFGTVIYSVEIIALVRLQVALSRILVLLKSSSAQWSPVTINIIHVNRFCRWKMSWNDHATWLDGPESWIHPCL